MYNKKSIVIFLAFYIFLMGFLALGSFDYNFSVGIVNPASLWANFFNLFGEMPANLLVLTGVTILFGSRNKEIPLRNGLAYVISIPLMVLLSWFVVYLPIQYLYENFSSGLAEGMPGGWKKTSYFLGLLLFAAAWTVQRKISDERLKELRSTAILFIILVLGEVIIVNILKVVWGRPRMRIIDSADQFRKWYIISFPSQDNNYKSFPSGHTANAFASIAWTLLAMKDGRLNRRIVLAAALVWGVLTALSRVVLGAHFLSDVITGGYITIFLFLLLDHLFFRKKRD